MLQIDDPWWDRHYPPNRCRCVYAESLSQRELDKLGLSGFRATARADLRLSRQGSSTGRSGSQSDRFPAFNFNIGQAALGRRSISADVLKRKGQRDPVVRPLIQTTFETLRPLGRNPGPVDGPLYFGTSQVRMRSVTSWSLSLEMRSFSSICPTAKTWVLRARVLADIWHST